MTKERPTNETVVKMLEQISRELGDVKNQQKEMKARLDEIHKGLSR